MSETILRAAPLSADAFSPYGDVIAARADSKTAMNEARFERYDRLARIDVEPGAGGEASIGIVRARSATAMPYAFRMVERHPLGSQAFVPLAPFRFVVVVAPPGNAVEADALRAFVSNGHQGINYRRGTWHMPLIALEAGQEFLVVDRAGSDNCEEHWFDRPVIVSLE